MTLTQAMQEAYAANPAGEIVIETLEFDHISFDEPVRIATGVEDDISLPPADGVDAVLFKAVNVSIVLPGIDENGPTPMRIKVDNVAGLLLPYVRLASQSTDPIEVTYRAYTTTDLTKPGDVIDGFQLSDVSLTATSAEATINLKEVELQAFPLATYDETYYPALQYVV